MLKTAWIKSDNTMVSAEDAWSMYQLGVRRGRERNQTERDVFLELYDQMANRIHELEAQCEQGEDLPQVVAAKSEIIHHLLNVLESVENLDRVNITINDKDLGIFVYAHEVDDVLDVFSSLKEPLREVNKPIDGSVCE